MRTRHLLAALGLGAILASGCRAAARPTGASIVVVDAAGDTVRLAKRAVRIVSLIPASTELLFAMGAGPQLVGRTRWCVEPAAAASVPVLGDGLAPNIEALLAARPDLVVLYQSALNAEAVRRLRELGIPAVQLKTDRLDDIARAAGVLGPATGHIAEADSVLHATDSLLAIATHPPLPTSPRVLVVQWDQPPFVAAGGSHLSELLVRAGARNVFGDLPQASAQVSIEAIAQRDPDLVLVTADTPPAWTSRPEWQVVRAVRERRIVRVHGTLFNWAGPRAPIAVDSLAAALARAPR